MISERRYAFIILGASFLWAIDLLVRYPITLKMNFVSIIFIESLIGLLLVSPWIFRNTQQIKALFLKDWLIAFFIGGIGMSAAGYLQTVCIQKATPGLFSFFQIFQPLLVISFAHLLFKEKLDNLYVYWGIWIILSAFLMFSVDLQLMMSSEVILSDILIAILTMIIWGTCTILGKIFLKCHSVGLLVSLRWTFGFLVSTVIFVFENERLPLGLLSDPEIVVRFLFMGGVAGIFSMYLYYKGLQVLEAARVSFIEISYSAFGMMFSALYTFETITLFQILGAASFFIFLTLFLVRKDSTLPTKIAEKLTSATRFKN